jgi:formamidopyrimidine-DNA glycosylase
MPELSKVETLSRQLRNIISGRKILSSKVYDHKVVNIKNVRGRRVITVERNSKMINILLDDGNSISVQFSHNGKISLAEECGKAET